MRDSRRLAIVLLMLGATLTLTGCGGGDRPPLGRVTGTVTMGGQPLDGVIVLFKPESGRPAAANTDVKGYYDLEYVYKVKGAKVGPNTVSFEWPLGKSGPPIAEKYGSRSELKADVKAGRNKFDFELEPADPKAPRPTTVVE